MHEQVCKVGSSERPWNQVKRNNGEPRAMSFTSGMHYLAVAGTCSLLLEQTMVSVAQIARTTERKVH
jgi:hypothetical protein